MRIDSVADAITNSSSEIFTFGTKSLDEVYDALTALWDEYRGTPEAKAAVTEDGSDYLLDYELGDLLVMGKGTAGYVYAREEDEYLLKRLGFNRAILGHFGDLITNNTRS